MKKFFGMFLPGAGWMLSGFLLLAQCTAVAETTPEPSSAPAGKAALRLFVVRHCQAWKNVKHDADLSKEKLDSLTEKGLAQAEALGTYLKDQGVAAVIASPTGRTRQTAEAIGKAAGLKPAYTESAALASLKKGTTPEGEKVDWAWRLAQWKGGTDPKPKGGESLTEGLLRAKKLIQDLAKKHSGKAVVVVSHSDITLALVGEGKGTGLVKRAELHSVPTGSVSEIVIADGKWTLKKQGEMPGK